MTDVILENARKRRAVVMDELRRLEEFIALYGELQQGLPTGRTADTEYRTMPGTGPVTSAESTPKVRTGNTLAATEQAVIAILKESGKPMPTSALRSILEARGVEVRGKDPNSTLSARLSRAPALFNERTRGWWLKESAGDLDSGEDQSPAVVEQQASHLPEPSAKGREAGPGGGT